MRVPDRQCIGVLGAVRPRTITVDDSFGTQTKLFGLVVTRTANDHVQKYQAVFLADNPILLACD
jgi:hypothetical protein